MADKKKLKAIVYGVMLILAAIAGYLVAALDGDPATKPDIKEAIEGVKEGVEVIKDAKGEDAPEATEPPEPAEAGGTSSLNERTNYEMVNRDYKGCTGHNIRYYPLKTC
ncbi:MAG TPA: hypothetical protein VFI27_15805 [candidate division Zixibacteria bacterium]|nr:hypothetical protein [candidate division Zixibacteria bacterium]